MKFLMTRFTHKYKVRSVMPMSVAVLMMSMKVVLSTTEETGLNYPLTSILISRISFYYLMNTLYGDIVLFC